MYTAVRRYLGAASLTLARASAAKPFTARRAAGDFALPLMRSIGAEIRWMFTPPRTCLMGVAANAVLAALWLLFQPLTRHGLHNDLVVVLDTYFASFILADVTTTNMLGADPYRVQAARSAGTPVWRILLVKNAALFVIIAVPTLLAAAVLTVALDEPWRLARTVPNVLVPIVTWLGVGNLVSVLLPVAAAPLLRRWRRRRDTARIAWWIAALTLPYALYYIADPIGGIEHRVFWDDLPAAIGPILGRDTKSFVHLGIAVAVWAAGTAAAALWAHRRGLRIR